jgi:hypothetical protein
MYSPLPTVIFYTQVYFQETAKYLVLRLLHVSATNPTVQYNTVQYSTIQYNTIQYSTVQYNTAQYVYPWDTHRAFKYWICAVNRIFLHISQF